VLLDGVGELHSFVLSDGMDLRVVEVRVSAVESCASFQGNYRKCFRCLVVCRRR
jgi:hypothetical protein